MKLNPCSAVALVACAFAVSGLASAVPLAWADWTAADATSASGTIGGIGVTFTGNLNPPAQVAGGENYWAASPEIFVAPGLDNAPPDADIIRLNGGPGTGVQTITFDAPVTNPVMAILSLGQAAWLITYVFDAEFDVLNFGPGYWGGPGTLTELPGNVLEGAEGHGLIQFIGTFTSISFTIPDWEDWHGFQIGVPEIARVPEPGTLALLALAVATLAASGRRRRYP